MKRVQLFPGVLLLYSMRLAFYSIIYAVEWGFRRRRTLIPKGTRTAFQVEGEQCSERSDAGISIVQEVFGFVKKNLSGAQWRQAAEQEKGCGEKGRQPFSLLSPK